MKIMVSACLLGENCKYSGGNNYLPEVAEFVKGHEVIPVCPEVMGGLPVPRPPCEIVKGEVINNLGESRDREYHLGAEKALAIAKEKNIDLAILKSRSPSCGVTEVYDGSFSGKLIPGSGVFAGILRANGFKVVGSDEVCSLIH